MTKRVTFSKQLKYVVCCIVFSYIHRTLTKASVPIRIFKKRNKKAADAKRPTVKTAWNCLRGGQIKLLNFCNRFFYMVYCWFFSRVFVFFRVFFVSFFDKLDQKELRLQSYHQLFTYLNFDNPCQFICFISNFSWFHLNFCWWFFKTYRNSDKAELK